MLPIFSRPLIIILAFVSAIGIVSAAFFSFSGGTGVAHQYWRFQAGGAIGNAGTVSFSQSDNPAWLDGNQLVGDFYLETVWVISFMSWAQINPPASGKVIDLWTVSGTASGIYCGEIQLDGVSYDPNSKKLTWAWWNHGIGRVPFGTTTTLITWGSIVNDTISEWFQWRVKVLGNIGGNSSFDTFYTLGARLNTSLMNDTLQRIRKNVAIITRNIPPGYANSFATNTPQALGNKIIYTNTTSTYQVLTYSTIPTSFPTDSIDSLIVIGGDLIIDRDIYEPVVKKNPKGIIVLKNEAWAGGNIIVTNAVKKIESSIFTEGTLYSGNSRSDLYNDSIAEIASLGENQLYIHGSLISRNTIGGSFTTPSPTCVYGETTATCTPEWSIQYDLNYFRQTPPNRTIVAPAPSTRGYGDDITNFDNYSLIIEIDPRLAVTPPPGF